MSLFNAKKKKQEAIYVKLCALERHGATCESCKKRRSCRNIGDVCASYAGKTGNGVEFF